MTAASNQSLNCFHCGLFVEHNVPALINNESVPCCCLGCKSIAESIHNLGLSSFYELREIDSEALEESRVIAQEKLSTFSQYDDPTYFKEESDGSFSTFLYLNNIHCAACVWLIESSLKQLKGIEDIQINLSEKQLHLSWQKNEHKLSFIIEHLAKLGYKARPVTYEAQDIEEQASNRSYLKKLALSGFASAQVMMLSLAIYIGEAKGSLSPEYQQFILWVSALITIPIFFISGQIFFISAFRVLKQKKLNMDVPVSIALTLALLVSLKNTFQNITPVYFDTICMLIFFLSLSRYFERWMSLKARFSFRLNAQKIAQFYTRIENNEEQKIPATELRAGDILLLKEGDFLPVDACVLEGESSVNESVLTGEFSSILKQTGDILYAGTSNGDAALKVKVLASAKESTLGVIEELARRAQFVSSTEPDVIEKISRWFVFIILVVSCVNLIFWFYKDSAQMFETTLAMLIVSCPCALALAVPLARTNAKYQLMKRGLLPLSTEILSKMHGITDIVFDKTGTLTRGKFELIHVELAPTCGDSLQDVLSKARALEQHSNHPIASAFSSVKQYHSVEALTQNFVGEGLQSVINGQTLRIGELSFVLGGGDISNMEVVKEKESSMKSIYLASQTELLARFDIGDQLKSDYQSLMPLLKNRGLDLHVLSGDTSERVADLAPHVADSHLLARQTAEQKLAYVEKLKKEGKCVLTIGDGNNDAPFVSSGNVGIAMSEGTQLTQSNSDALLLSNKLMPIEDLFVIYETYQKKLKQNLFWAFLYNFSVLPLASLGFVPPYLAAAGMSLSSLVVVLNSTIWKQQAENKNIKDQKEPGSISSYPGSV